MSLPSLECKYVTEECIREWKIGGNTNFRIANPVPLLRFLYELCWVVVKGELPLPKFKAALDSVEYSEKCSPGTLGSTLADVVTQLANDFTMPGDHRLRLIKLAKWLVESALVSMRLFQERCEEEFLWDAEMIKIKAQDLKSKEVRVNTRLLYQQTKFNLLREESEGYSKLITLLCRGSDDISRNASSAIIGIIKSLIGHFDLDPNRVFDIVLDCFELQPDNDVFIELIPIFPRSNASQILGFKFQYYQRMEAGSPAPLGLYKITALLIKKEFIDLESLYGHLLPKDEEAFDTYNSFSAKRLDEANKIGKINLAATGKDLMDDEKLGDVTIDLFAALNMEAEALAELSPQFENSQTLGLLAGFLSVDDWYHAHILFERLSPLSPVTYVQICDGLLRLIDLNISPVYSNIREVCVQNSGSPLIGTDPSDLSTTVSSSFSLSKEIFQMLATVGPYLCRNTILLQKLCRVLKGYLEASELAAIKEQDNFKTTVSQNARANLKEARSRVEEALGSCILPSLQLIPANPAVSQEIWGVMNLLPYEARYRLYGEWEKEGEQNPLLLSARQTAKLDTRRILKRLAKENLKQLGRMVAKLAHANPMTVLRTIVHQIEAYRDMIAPVVDAFKYLTQLEYDILEYVVIERLAQAGRDKLKEDGLNLSDWLQSLASFWGHLCKKYPSMELRGLFQYLVNQLKKGHGIELVVLQELVQQMANVQYTENLTEEQLDAMAGSDTLRYQATSFGLARNNKALIKSTNRLRDSLLPRDEPKLAIPLLLLIAQHRSLVVINADAPYIKMVSEQFDRCHGTLLQYVDFLSCAITPASAYTQLVPSLHDLVHLYHLDPEVAFIIYRPAMRLFKCEGASEVFWPLDNCGTAISNADSGIADETENLILDLGPSRKPLRWSELLDTVKCMLPSKAWNSLSPDLYATFWGLTLYDLCVPRNRYEAEIAKQHAALKTLEELSDNSSSAINKRKKDKERIQESLDRLTAELHVHEEHVASVRRRLSREKDKWLSSCPDTLKINMEFLQRCIFPRCTFSMPDAVYCAIFVHTLHSLGTPFFNTVNHIDVLICKTLQPMICCCTEYEAGRLGRFLYETLKIAYHWKSDESIYERECGNMPGFAVYYRFPNSQRVTYGQFVKVHWKWSQRISRLLIQCLESTEYMEIRNALILLTKISGVFPVTKRSGINIEKRVSRIKSDEREDLKVLATGVAAALASRKSYWVSDEEFGMGYVDIKPQSTVSKPASGNLPSQSNSAALIHHLDSGSISRELLPRNKVDGRADAVANVKSDQALQKSKSGSSVTTSEMLAENKKQVDESAGRSFDGSANEVKPGKRTLQVGCGNKTVRQEQGKDDGKLGKATGRGQVASSGDKDAHFSEGRYAASALSVAASNGNTAPTPSKGTIPSAKPSEISDTKADNGASKYSLREDQSDVPDFHKHSSRVAHSPRHDKISKRNSPSEDHDRVLKRRKGDNEIKDFENDRERSIDARSGDVDKSGSDDQHSLHKATDKLLKGGERYEKDHKEKTERFEKPRGDDNISEKAGDRLMERYGRECSVEKNLDRADRTHDKASEKIKEERPKEERSKLRHGDITCEKSHTEERFHGQALPPPPPLPLHLVPQSAVSSARREEDSDRRFGAAKSQKLSPKHDERERRRSEENMILSHEDSKRRREEDFRERIRDERDMQPMKVEDREREREREREKASVSKEELDANAAASKRRKLKRDHMQSGELGEFSPAAAGPPVHSIPQPYDGRDRKGGMIPRAAGYMDESSLRIHPKEAQSKIARRDAESLYEREWDDEKRQRADQKRRHRK